MPWRRKERNKDLDSELSSHLDLEAEEQQESGLAPDQARFAARRAFGNTTLVKEAVRNAWGWRPLENINRDVRHAFRTVSRNPGFTAVATLTLALGIGANTAIFSVVHGVLIRPVAVEAIDRLVVARVDMPGLNLMNSDLTGGSTVEMGRRDDLFEAFGGWSATSYNLTGLGEPQRIAAAETVGEFFEVFGVQPEVGALYSPEHSEPGRQFVTVLDHSFWQRTFGGDRSVIGRKLELNGQPFEMVGVLPPDFRYPRTVELFTPMLSGTRRFQSAMGVTAVGRKLRGLTDAALSQQVHAEGLRWVEERGIPKHFGHTLRTTPFTSFYAGQLRPVLLVLVGAVVLVLLIACANVAGLQMARTFGRQREFAVRVALGAGRWPLVRQVIVHSVVLAALGGAGAVAIGYVSVKLIANFSPDRYSQLGGVHLDSTALIVTGVVALAAGLIAGLGPALRAARTDLRESLNQAAQRATAGAARHRWLSGFAVVQTALALVLLTGSFLMFRTLRNLLATDHGFRTDNVVSMEFALPRPHYSVPMMLSFASELDIKLQHLPVVAAGITSVLPLTPSGSNAPFRIDGRSEGFGDRQQHANMRVVSAGFFRTMEIPLLAGRMFTDQDRDGAPLVCLIDEQLARQFFAGDDPIGLQITQGRPSTIVGIVGSVANEEAGGPTKATIYYPAQQWPVGNPSVVVRSQYRSGAVAELVKAEVAQLDPNLPLHKIRTMRELVDESLGPRRLAQSVLVTFAGLALILTLLGIYGVLNYLVAERTREIGIRQALGARPGEVVAMIVRRGGALMAVGVSLGIVGSLLLTGFVGALLHGVSHRDPLTLTLSAGVLTVAGLAASWLPARRAVRVDPTIALRHE